MGTPAESASHSSRGRIASVLAGVGAVTGVAALGAAAAAGAAGAMVANAVVRPPRRRAEPIQVFRVWEDEEGLFVELEATADSRLAGDPGVYSLWFGDGSGHAVVGEIVKETWDRVVRRVLRVDAGTLTPAITHARMNGWVWLDPESAGIERYENVLVPAPLGENPAWFVPGRRDSTKWMIHVHGRAAERAETLRGVQLAQERNFQSLVITYRNDLSAVPSPDRRYALGATEWHDVEAAIEYALERGATKIVLMGWSMGGAAVLQTAVHSSHRDVIAGLILDSPVVDWRETLIYQSESAGIPEGIRRIAMGLLSTQPGRRVLNAEQAVDWDALDWVTRASELTVPTLILHSDDDGYVPSGPSRELAAARPELVTLVPFHTARHCKLWNFDRPLWERSIVSWMRAQHLSAGKLPPIEESAPDEPEE
ncbi:MAG: lysophospholipase [Microbacteriaceae bacterium]|jgi:pimeloyl-ACP methyl ester carboxylesterase|nr:lysophospholipase [Microbacteriaceae bacterium]